MLLLGFCKDDCQFQMMLYTAWGGWHECLLNERVQVVIVDQVREPSIG